MQTVLHGLTNHLVASRLQRCQQQCNAPSIKGHICLWIAGGQQLSPFDRIHRERGRKNDRLEFIREGRLDRMYLPAHARCGDKATE